MSTRRLVSPRLTPLYAIIDSSLVRGKAVLWTRPVTYAELHPTASTVATR